MTYLTSHFVLPCEKTPLYGTFLCTNTNCLFLSKLGFLALLITPGNLWLVELLSNRVSACVIPTLLPSYCHYYYLLRPLYHHGDICTQKPYVQCKTCRLLKRQKVWIFWVIAEVVIRSHNWWGTVCQLRFQTFLRLYKCFNDHRLSSLCF